MGLKKLIYPPTPKLKTSLKDIAEKVKKEKKNRVRHKEIKLSHEKTYIKTIWRTSSLISKRKKPL